MASVKQEARIVEVVEQMEVYLHRAEVHTRAEGLTSLQAELREEQEVAVARATPAGLH